MAVAIQPAGNTDSREHYSDTVEKPVNISEYEQILGLDLEQLLKVSKNGSTALWGVTPGKNNVNVSKYKKLSKGDVVIFTRDKTAYASAKITYLFRNKLMAEKLWGKDKNRQTWEYMYALDGIEKINFTYTQLQKAIGSSSGDNFMGFRVLNRQKSNGALELLGKPVQEDKWMINIGQELKRSDVQKIYGGAHYGGIEPSAKTPNILIFTNPYKKSAFGYNFDAVLEDGTFTYTGDGQIGDQNPDSGGNKSILEHRKSGRSLRVFESTKKATYVRYLGEFELGSPEYSIKRAPDLNKKERDVLVFNLNPIGVTEKFQIQNIEPIEGGVRRKSSERLVNEQHSRKSYTNITIAERREIQLQDRYKAYIKSLGYEIDTVEIQLSGEGTILKPDLINFSLNEVIEVKSGVSRKYLREAIGQVLDYTFQIAKLKNINYQPVILVPGKLSNDLMELLKFLNISIVFENTVGDFEKINNGSEH
jgi:hypothetical protein